MGKLFNPELAIFSILYGLAIGTISYKMFNKSYDDLASEVSVKESEINTRIIDIQKLGTQMVSLRAEKLELDKLIMSFRNREGLAKKSLMIEIKSEFSFGILNQMYSPILYMIFPQMSSVFFMNRCKADFFNLVTNTVLNRMRNIIGQVTEVLPNLEVSLQQIEKFQHLVEKWNKFNDLRLLEKTYNSSSQIFSIRNLKVHIPKEKGDRLERIKEILSRANLLSGKNYRGINIEFQKGKVYLFPDLSGSGKTTFLKSILGMFPFASGSVFFPCLPDEVRYVSRNTVLPTKGTLLEAISFPKTPTETDTLMVEKYIDEMRFTDGKKHKKQLTEKADWSSKLSDGEKQRFAMIGVLLAKPKILILDEALGNLDKPSKNLVEKLVKSSLPDTVILYADHHPIPGFADYIVNLNKDELSCVASKGKDNERNFFSL